jgi:hypothetical protein
MCLLEASVIAPFVILGAPAVAMVYLCVWLLFAVPFLWMSARPNLSLPVAIVVGAFLGALRLGSGLVTLWALSRASAWNRLDPLSAPVLYGLPWVEAAGLAVITAGTLAVFGTPRRRALLAGVALELASAAFAWAVGLRSCLEERVERTPGPQDVAHLAWDPETNIGIDEAGDGIAYSDRIPGPFDEVEGWCLHRAGPDGTWCKGAPALSRARWSSMGTFGVRPDGGLYAPEDAGPALAAFGDRLDLLDVAADSYRVCVVGSDGVPACVARQSHQKAPLEAPPPPPATRIALHGQVACSIDPAGDVACAGNVGCWVPAPPGPFRSIHPGAAEVCAARVDGTITCWEAPGLPPLAEGVRDARPDPTGRGFVDATGRIEHQRFPIAHCPLAR